MLYAIDEDKLMKQEVREFSALDMKERGDLQRLLRAEPAALGEDLLVIAESDQPRHKRSREFYRRIRPQRFAMDILVYTPEEVRRGSQTPVSFVSQVLREGKTVYVRGA